MLQTGWLFVIWILKSSVFPKVRIAIKSDLVTSLVPFWLIILVNDILAKCWLESVKVWKLKITRYNTSAVSPMHSSCLSLKIGCTHHERCSHNRPEVFLLPVGQIFPTRGNHFQFPTLPSDKTNLGGGHPQGLGDQIRQSCILVCQLVHHIWGLRLDHNWR